MRVSKTATTLVLGVAVGALTVVLYRRFRVIAGYDDPDAIINKMGQQIDELEKRIDAEAAE